MWSECQAEAGAGRNVARWLGGCLWFGEEVKLRQLRSVMTTGARRMPA